MTNLLVADDQELVRTGFRMILEAEPDVRIVGEAADGREAVAQARRTRPEVVLMDVRMPGMDGIEATRVLRDGADPEQGPHVLALTTFDLDEHVYDSLRAGAAGFLRKDVRAEQLLDAVRLVAAGAAMIAPGVTRRLIAEFARRERRPSRRRAWTSSRHASSRFYACWPAASRTPRSRASSGWARRP